MGLFTLGYRRPVYVDKESYQSSLDSIDSSDSGSLHEKTECSASTCGIPSALTFDKVLDGATCPPCSLRDFMNYLVYVERSAENLQFFLWYRDFSKRFYEAPEIEQSLASEWTVGLESVAVARVCRDQADKLLEVPPAALLKGTAFEKDDVTRPIEINSPFTTTRPASATEDSGSMWNRSQSTISYQSLASEEFTQAGVRQPFTIQPFRTEVNHVITTYIAPNSPRQLNLSERELKVVMQALAYTTHPTAFRYILPPIEATLRHQAHPNFIRWSIGNASPARVHFARALGASLVLGGFALAVSLALSRHARAWRALAAVAWLLGVATLVAAGKGMCVVLHGLHHHHVRPWELFASQEPDACDVLRLSMEAFGGANSYEDEPWVGKYARRNIVRKIFDRQVWVREPALRKIQDTIFVQSLLCGLVVAAVLTGIFVALPAGNFY